MCIDEDRLEEVFYAHFEALTEEGQKEILAKLKGIYGDLVNVHVTEIIQKVLVMLQQAKKDFDDYADAVADTEWDVKRYLLYSTIIESAIEILQVIKK